MGFFFIWISPKRFRGCEEDCLLCFVAFSSTRNQSILQDRLNAPRTTSVKDVLFPVVRSRRVSHNFWHYRNTTRVSLNLLEGNTRNFCDPHSIQLFSYCFFLELTQFNTVLRNVALHASQTPSAIPNSRCPNDMIHLVLVLLDRNDVPVWRPCSDRAPLYEGFAGITIHFLSFVGMAVFFEQRTTGRTAEIVCTSFLVPYRLVTW